MVVTTFDVAVRETEELSVYVADAWFPMDVPAAVCAAVIVGTIRTAAISANVKKKGHPANKPVPLLL
jgi:hypothetical protein